MKIMNAEDIRKITTSRNRSDDDIRLCASTFHAYLDKDKARLKAIKNITFNKKPLLECLVRMCLPTMDRRSVKFAWILIRHGVPFDASYVRHARTSAYKAAKEAFASRPTAESGLKSARYWFNVWNVLADHMEYILSSTVKNYDGIVLRANRNTVRASKPPSATREKNYKMSKKYEFPSHHIRTTLPNSTLPRIVRPGSQFDVSSIRSVENIVDEHGKVVVEHPWKNATPSKLVKAVLGRMGRDVPQKFAQKMVVESPNRPENIVLYRDTSAHGGRTRRRARQLDVYLKQRAFSANEDDGSGILEEVLSIDRTHGSRWSMMYAWVLLRHGAIVTDEFPGFARRSAFFAAEEAYFSHKKHGVENAIQMSRFWFVAWFALVKHLELILRKKFWSFTAASAIVPGYLDRSHTISGTKYDISSIEFELGPLVSAQNTKNIHPWRRRVGETWNVKFQEEDTAFRSLEEDFRKRTSSSL